MGQEGDDVVLGLALDLVDPRDVEGDVACLGPDRLGGFLGDDAEFGLRVRRMRLDLEPDLEAGLRLPDGGHFRTGIAGDHQALQANCFLRRALANRTGRGHPYGAARAGKPRALAGPKAAWAAATGWLARTRRQGGQVAHRFACPSWSL